MRDRFAIPIQPWAQGRFWFEGLTDDGVTSVLYQLHVTGNFEFASSWPENDNLMLLRNWTIDVANEGRSVRNMSCVGSGDSGDGPDFMTAGVTRVDP